MAAPAGAEPEIARLYEHQRQARYTGPATPRPVPVPQRRPAPGRVRQYALRMSAARSKQLQMRSCNIDRVLRHRRQLNLRDIIDNREGLNVDGRMGSTGVNRPACWSSSCSTSSSSSCAANSSARSANAYAVPEARRGTAGDGRALRHRALHPRAAGVEATVCYQYSAQLRDAMVGAGTALRTTRGCASATAPG
jgi:hypothetical protein